VPLAEAVLLVLCAALAADSQQLHMLRLILWVAEPADF
jgi:hypothetical protein